MQDLRLVGVHDDGEHLLLSGTGGEMFRLPIDEALRLAASRSPAKAAAAVAPVAMSPRDIQSRIRSGATAAEVSELSGIPLAKVQRYEGPVLAEDKASPPPPPHPGPEDPGNCEWAQNWRKFAENHGAPSVLTGIGTHRWQSFDC